MTDISKFHFKGLEEGEEILKVVHRNWFYIFEQFLWLLLFSAVMIAAFVFAPLYFPDLLGSVSPLFVSFVENFFLLAAWIYGFLIWIDYFFDIWIITSERIVNIEQKGLFTRKVSEMRYDKIQDLTVEVAGFIPTMINFGDIQIQTAAEEGEFHFRTVSDPYHLKNLIMEVQRKNSHPAVEK